jgi:hypothetical protein
LRSITTRTLLAFLLSLAAASARAQETGGGVPVDLELVIAVDVSRSMDDEEFRLQRDGYVEAIRHPDFVRAVMSGGYGRIALAYVEWSGRLYQKIVVPWRVIDGSEAAERFAEALQQQPPVIGRGTSISAAIVFGSKLFDASGYQGARRVIDISGDGPNNYGPAVTQARDWAIGNGIVINGLPILIRPSPIVPDIVRYYSDCVVGGPGSFVLPVRKVEGLKEAIRRKLVLEVAGQPRADIIPARADAPSDCLAGEKARQHYSDPFYPQLDK